MDKVKIVKTIILFIICFSISTIACLNAPKIISAIDDIKIVLFMILFLVCALLSICIFILNMYNNYKLKEIAIKVFSIIVLIIWFSLLSIFTVIIIDHQKNLLCILFFIPFWIIGFRNAYSIFIKKNK